MAIELYNKNSIREHQDSSPLIDAAFSKAHSFIFPGDEIVACTKLIAPLDFGGSFKKLKINSVKMSVIAEKQNIFSREFSNEFAATRSFELDSVSINVDSSNAPIVLWGSDGYAPNINFTQDRTWKFPSGDFRKQVKAHTTHTASTAQWEYNFFFPILFRWEYWKYLILADNDFYDTTKSQNGKNQKWLRYSNLSVLPFGWKIKYRFEVKYKNGTNGHTSISDLELTNTQDSVRDYSSNSDYSLKEIKTSLSGGTPSNTPAIIAGDQNTSCYAYFTKQTAWDAGEKEKLSALFWIEPFEGAGLLSRTRGSSLYSTNPETVFIPLSYIAATDDDDIITRDNGDIFAMDYDGAEVNVSFDPLNDLNIICSAEIDYNKLKLFYPGIQKFTLYCRLNNNNEYYSSAITTSWTIKITGSQFVSTGTNTYTISGIPTGYTFSSVQLPQGWSTISTGIISGGTQTFSLDTSITSGKIRFKYIKGALIKYAELNVYVNNARMGEEIKQDCIFINTINNITPSLFCETDTNCDFNLEVFADPDDPTNEFHNDKSDFYFYGSAAIASIDIIIQKYSNGAFVDIQPIISSAFGKFFAYGSNPDFSGNSFTDDYNKKYTGVYLEWLSIYLNFGSGKYRIKTIKTDIFGGTFIEYRIDEYCLYKWNCFNTDGTVRIDIFNKGLRGTIYDKSIQIDYANGWYGQIRLPGIIYEVKPSFTKEFNQYGDKDHNELRPIIQELIPQFEMDIKPGPGWLDRYLANYVLLSNSKMITDFNSSNRKPIIKIPVVNENGIDTKDDDFVNKLAWSKISFRYGQNNLRQRNS